MNIEIYYFTGSGNSLAVAKDLAAKMDAILIPIASLLDVKCVDTSADCIGIVFPIYDFKTPKIVDNFINKIANPNSKYIFAVGTYGIAPLKTMKYLDRLILTCGGKLSGGFAVKMPHNGIGSSKFSHKQHEKMFDDWKKQLEIISEYVIARKEGKLETTSAFVSLVMSGLFISMIPTLIKLLRQVMFKGWESLSLNANEKCIGCESCIKLCPVNNIKMLENKPSWGKDCAGCLACLHWCPNEAIQIGQVNMNIKKYHHPDIKITEIMKQKICK